MIRIIGICGFKRSGKDTIADYLVSNYRYKKLKFATPLKLACKEMFGFTDNQLEQTDKEAVDPVWNITPRRAMQFIGTEIMQYKINELLPDMGKLFWVKRAMQQIENSQEQFVISDLRFMHEYNYLKAKYGDQFRVIKVVSNATSLESDTHVSEQEWVKIPHDILVDNSGTLADLYSFIDQQSLT